MLFKYKQVLTYYNIHTHFLNMSNNINTIRKETINTYEVWNITKDIKKKIRSYEEFCEDSDIEIKITKNTNRIKGFYKFKNKPFREFTGKKMLNEIIKHNSSKDKHNRKEILEDILNKCYTDNYQIHELNYNEYLINYLSLSPSSACALFNSVERSFTSMNEFDNDKILLDKGRGNRFFNIDGITNIGIVDDIIGEIVNDKKHIEQFKKLTKNILVEQGNNDTIFIDYGECQFATWLRHLLYSISSKRLCVSDDLFYDDKKLFLEIKGDIRCIRICSKTKDVLNPEQIKNIIKPYQNLGIKNFIIEERDKERDKKQKTYNMVRFNSYLKNNNETLMKIINKQIEKCKSNLIINTVNLDLDIFYSTNCLLTNFLKWCC